MITQAVGGIVPGEYAIVFADRIFAFGVDRKYGLVHCL